MRALPFLIVILILSSVSYAQSPHGKDFKLDCNQCHSEESWKVTPAKITFKHSETGFNLVGQHQTVQCRLCHSTLVFSDQKEKTTCNNCHKDIHENTVGHDCAKCHSPNTWIVEDVSDIHRMGRFPLLGNHAKADCSQCHKSASKLRFDPLGISCFDCHQANYMAAQNPNHVQAGFSTDCQQCHTISSPVWATTTVVHSFFPLVGGHAIVNCFECHSQTTYKGLTQDCYSCHQKHYEAASSPNHMSLNFSKDCKQCHTTDPGWKPATFTIHDSIYPLVGAHNVIRNDCNKCHASGYAGTPKACVGCHQSNYDNSTNPNHKAAGFSTDCATCHTSVGWTPSTFDHDGQYFPIYSGKHLGRWNLCSDCHTNSSNLKVFECINCHTHNKADTDSKHTGVNGYVYQSSACYACHPKGSKDGVIDHSLTNFPLVGQHVNVACQQCHTSGYVGTSAECVSCHQAKYTTAPNHTAQNYPQDCKQCHTPVDWKQITFNHGSTIFPLTGAHVTVTCQTCHATKLAGLSTECVSCHQDKYNSAPNHVAQSYPTDCKMCHSTTVWTSATFDHSTTPFPLTGAHTTVACASCHTVGFNVGQTPNTCYSCHQTNYSSTTNPNHVTSKIPTTCDQCHSTTAWQPSTFNHSTTPFPLTGAHTTVACASCHTVGYSVGQTSSVCYSCHQTNYNNTTNPNHSTSKIPTTCEQCHSTTAWQPSTFNHSTTPFPLTGAHTTVACASCHTVGYSSGQTPNNCYGCHQTTYNNTTNPNHVSAKFPTTCEQCHSTTNWTTATFNHSTTPFPLTGAHTSVACASCHTVGYNVGQTPNACYACHQANYNATTNPNHVSAKFPTTCDQCHTTTAWSPASFNHSTTPFPLTGAHTTVPCASCHTVGYNVGQTPNTCYACHQAKYNSTTNPNHSSAQFPTACEQCHTTTAWTPSTFNHDGQYFPIYSGKHNGKWTLCSDCHTNSTNFKVFTCINCHEHSDKTKVDGKHSGVSGYVYSATSCYTCHPAGSSGG